MKRWQDYYSSPIQSNPIKSNQMRTRNQSRNHKDDPTSGLDKSETREEEGSLAKISIAGVGKFLSKANSRRGKKQSLSTEDENDKFKKETAERHKELEHFNLKGCTSKKGKENTLSRESNADNRYNNAYEIDWEEGDVSMSEYAEGYSHETGRTLNIEFTDSPSSTQKKRARRITAEDKELAELVHKAHLLCLLGRGQVVDNACNDSLIQASILSLLPYYLMKIMDVPDVKAHMLGPLVRWFRENFNVRSEGFNERSFRTNLACALEAREGSAEEIAALSVALFRALNLKARYVSILDVASLKPETDVATSPNDAARFDTKINSATYNKVARPLYPDVLIEQCVSQSQKGKAPDDDSSLTCENNIPIDDSNANISNNETKHSLPSKRKGDLEYEYQLEMALSATRIATNDEKPDAQPSSSSSSASALKKSKKENLRDSTTNSSAVWSRKAGPPLYWAEVYCSLETFNGRWVHIDAANGIVDGEAKVEAAAAASRRPLKYVVAFAGNGAKDVTRRYCTQWYKIAPRRINSEWWDKVLAPLKELELNAIIGTVDAEKSQDNASAFLDKKVSENVPVPLSADSIKSASNLAAGPSGFSLEDAELETRALTEPLPTNQLAYKNHHLYAIEKWLNKHQILHPKGPILGYCSGHSVYPRSCVQNLQTKQRWFREGLQVKANELPAKIIKRSKKSVNVQKLEDSISEEDDGGSEANLELYGKWQLEPLQLPHAVNGIVPKNEWGRVDAWSEKCLPHGTVHLRLPRLAYVAKRLDIDYASAMVGFEFKNGSSHPVYEGIVVCKEFKDAIIEAYKEEEERRESEERKKNEMQAIIRWRQLLSSIATRQRLQNSYVNASSSHIPQNTTSEAQNNKDTCSPNRDAEGEKKSEGKLKRRSSNRNQVFSTGDDHVHEYPIEKQSFDEDSKIRTKRCLCGFSIEVEEL